MSGHTLGPWALKLYGTGGFDVLTDEGVICMRHAWTRKKAESENNAHLIAAAPELKVLIDRAVDVLQRHILPDGLSDHEALNELYSIFDGPEYRAAIAKAEGRIA